MERLLRVLLLCISIGAFASSSATAQLVANFTANNVSGCSPIVVQFTDQSTGNPTSWNWNLGNGATSTLQNPSTSYITPGTYTITLTVSNGSSSDTKTITGYITVLASPVVNFTAADSSTSCAPKTIQFTNSSTTNGTGTTAYIWDFGDGTSSNAANPSHTYTSPGNYSVTLVVTNSNGCTKSLTKNAYINLVTSPNPSFTAANNNSCTTPATVTFTNTSTSATSYYWIFGDGNTSAAASPIHTYSSSGSYTVTLVANNAVGCSDTITQTAFVNIGSLHAAFTNNSTACTGNNVAFTNTSTPGPGNSTWHFGDGGTSTAASPTHVYNTPGTYTVKLVVNYNNCSDSTTSTITISQGPNVSFTANNTYSCTAPFTAQFNNSTSGATGYYWLFGDGGTSAATAPSHNYNSTGTYTVTLIATSANGCADTFTRTNYIVIAPPTAIITASPSMGCAPVNVTFTTAISPAATPVTATINYGDGTTINGSSGSHNYSTPGIYVVTYSYTLASGCTGTAQTTVSVGTQPTASFTAAPLIVCPGQSITFTNTSTNANGYTWSFGDGGTSTATNPVYTYSVLATGSFSVTLTASNNGCTSTYTIPNYITVNPPVANFTYTNNCSNRLSATFQDASIGATSWSWDFGDGTTSTQQNPQHTFPSYANYSVTLTVYDANTGCSNTITYTVGINAVPLLSVTANPTAACINNNINFTAGITYPSNISSYTWYYGDGTSLTNNTYSSTHAYAAAGIYTIKVYIQDTYGCTDSVVSNNYIQVGGAATNFTGTPLSGCVPLQVNFTDQTTDAPGVTINSRTWRFGNGLNITGNSTSTSNTYTAAGSYSVTLITTDSYGCTDSTVKPAYINAYKTTAGFTSADTNICTGVSVPFVNTSTGQGTLSYSWSFGDGGTSAAANPSHPYSANGNYTVRLIVTSTDGCADTLTRTAYIHVGSLNVGFTLSDSFATCPPLSVNITNTTAGINTYAWTFGNGTASNLTNPSALYTYPGTYTIKLIVHNNLGCTDSATKNVTVLGPTGTFSYNVTNGCSPLTVTLSSTNQNTTSLTYDLNNGFTQTTTASSYTYTYTQPGTFVPILILSNGTCQVPIIGSDTIKVDHVDADFNFTPNNLCQSGTVNFTDTTYSTLSSINMRSWTFGDGGTSFSHNPSHNYTGPGTYQVRLIIGNTEGCKDTIIKTVIINPNPVVTITGAQAICAGTTTPVQLQASGATTYSWTPATGLSCTNCANPTALPAATTTYIVTGTNTATGCSNTANATITVNPLPVITAGNQTICAGASVQLQASGGSIYSWSPATGLSCTACANPTASPAATTTYTVTGTNTNGCSNTANATVTVNPLPIVTVSPNQTICAGGSVPLQASGAATYSWSPATGLSCTACANPTASPAATTTYTVTGNSNGCSNTAATTVTVNPLPAISAGNNQSICTGNSAQLQAIGGTSYSWAPATGLSCTTCSNPVANPTATTTYTVTGTNANGCVNTANLTVTVNPLPAVNAGSDQTICFGSSATLTATGASTYVWTPATGLSCTACATTTANLTFTTTYIVTGTNTTTGCTNKDTVIVSIGAFIAIADSGNHPICSGGADTLHALGATSYTWSPATGLSCTSCANPVATPAVTTTYTITGTVGTCTGTAPVTVTVYPLPTVAINPVSPICKGTSATLQATSNNATTYSWSPATGLSCTACASPVASPTSTTTYTLTVTNANGCTNTQNITITVNQLPTVTVVNDSQTICMGTSATLQATGASSYIWSPATGLSATTGTTVTASPAATITYTVIGSDINNCKDTAYATVHVLPLPVVTVDSTHQNICLSNSIQLHANGAATYSWSPATGLSNANIANPVANPAATTAYTVTGTDANGCHNTAHDTVIVHQPPTITPIDTQVCAGSSVQLQTGGANSYVWSPATGLSCTTCANPVATPAVTTTYTITGTSIYGCTDSAHATVTVNPLPVVNAGSDVSICAKTSTQLHATGAISYSWSPAAGLSSIIIANPFATPAATTAYIVTGTNNNHCSNTDTVIVTVLPQPVVSAGSNTSVCRGDSTQLDATGAVSYVWSPATGLSSTTIANPVASPANPVNYMVIGTGSNNCTDTAYVTINIYPQPVISGGPDTAECNGGSVQLQASGGISYTWTPAIGLTCTTCPDPYSSISSDMTYKVIGIDANGCKDSANVTVDVIQRVPTSLGPNDTLCLGQSAQLSATGGIAYSWSPSAGLNSTIIGTPTATPTETTHYGVVITENRCFTDTGSVTVVVNPIPTVTLPAEQSIIAGGSITLSPQVTGDTLSYLWTPPTGLNCDTCANPVATPANNITYTLNVTSQAGCKAIGEIAITVGCDNSQVFIPNTFTPNGDGNNDRFYISGKGISIIKKISVFDRWGELMYSAENIPVNEQRYGWDGTYKGQQLKPDVFVYMVDALCETGQPLEFKGDISLVR